MERCHTQRYGLTPPSPVSGFWHKLITTGRDSRVVPPSSAAIQYSVQKRIHFYDAEGRLLVLFCFADQTPARFTRTWWRGTLHKWDEKDRVNPFTRLKNGKRFGRDITLGGFLPRRRLACNEQTFGSATARTHEQKYLIARPISGIQAQRAILATPDDYNYDTRARGIGPFCSYNLVDADVKVCPFHVNRGRGRNTYYL